RSEFLGRVPIPEASGVASISAYEASPTGTWIAIKKTVVDSWSIVRMNRATGESETLDPPAALLVGTTAPSSIATSITSIAVSDDGTLVMGYGDVGYRLVLIPGDGSPRV